MNNVKIIQTIKSNTKEIEKLNSIDMGAFATKVELDDKVDKVDGMGLSELSFTPEERAKLALINVDGGGIDTSNIATKDDLASKVDIVAGKDLSTNDFTDEYKAKVDEINEIIESGVLEVPTASDTVFGTVKIGEGLTLNGDGTLSPNSVNNLDSISDVLPLAASQGKVIADKLVELKDAIDNVEHPTVDLTGYYTKDETDALIPDISNLATKNEVDLKVDKVDGKDLSTNDYTDEDKAAVTELTKLVEGGVRAKTFAVNSADLVLNDTNGLYEYTLAHGLNSNDMTVSVFENETKLECLNLCERIDENNILVRNDENIDLSVVLSVHA